MFTSVTVNNSKPTKYLGQYSRNIFRLTIRFNNSEQCNAFLVNFYTMYNSPKKMGIVNAGNSASLTIYVKDAEQRRKMKKFYDQVKKTTEFHLKNYYGRYLFVEAVLTEIQLRNGKQTFDEIFQEMYPGFDFDKHVKDEDRVFVSQVLTELNNNY